MTQTDPAPHPTHARASPAPEDRPSHDAGGAEHELTLRRFPPSFHDPEVEADFRRDFFNRSRGILRAALFLGAAAATAAVMAHGRPASPGRMTRPRPRRTRRTTTVAVAAEAVVAERAGRPASPVPRRRPSRHRSTETSRPAAGRTRVGGQVGMHPTQTGRRVSPAPRTHPTQPRRRGHSGVVVRGLPSPMTHESREQCGRPERRLTPG